MDRVSGEVFQDFSHKTEVESSGDSFGLLECVLAVAPSVLAVTVLFSSVNVVGQVVFSGSDLFSLTRKTRSVSGGTPRTFEY